MSTTTLNVVNNAPTAGDDQAAMNEDDPVLSIPVLSNDSIQWT
ncbi:MAG: hypothetical protein R3C28_14380 [Pirellulaceae bacterium]